MNQKQTLELVREAFDALHPLDHTGWRNHRKELLALCIAEEKSHRGFADGFARCHPGAAGVTDCAKSFAVKRVAEYLTGEKMPRGKDFLHVQGSCFYAAGLVDEFRAVIRKAWRGLDVKAIAAVDYVVLVQPEGTK